MKEYVNGTKMVFEEVKATKLFLWLFYVVFVAFELFYYFIYPKLTNENIGIPENGLGYVFHAIIIFFLPITIILIKKGKPFAVKYLLTLGYLFFDTINNILIFLADPKKFESGNLVEIILILFSPIFINKKYYWVVSTTLIGKYILLAVILNEWKLFLPIVVLSTLSIVSYILLSRFISYIKTLTSAFDDLQHKEKLAFLGQMATSIGHEIRNPISSLRGFTQLQQERDASETNFYPIMIQEIDRINTIVDDLMIIGRPKSPNISLINPIDLLNYVSSVTNQLAETRGIKVQVIPCEDVPLVECDDMQIKQVLINVVKNAIESMPNGGRIEIDCLKEKSDRIKIGVQDQGTGIDPETLKKLGEPFYTTKPDGTGLGLMVSKKIIDDHQGEIHFVSELGKGTRVEIILPIKAN